MDKRVLALRKLLEKKNTSERVYDPAKQAEGYERRLKGSGINPEEAQDNRNWLEKSLNLKKDQNVLFDVFEVIGRPQQALFGALKASAEGEDVGKGALDGLTGNEETRFKDVLKSYGAEDSESGWGAIDLVGFAGDVFLDPVDIALFGANPAKVAKATKAVDTAVDSMRATDAVLDATRVGSVARDAAEQSVRKSTQTLKGAATRAGFQNSDEVVSIIADNIKGGRKVTEGITADLGKVVKENAVKLDERLFKRAEELEKNAKALLQIETNYNVAAVERSLQIENIDKAKLALEAVSKKRRNLLQVGIDFTGSGLKKGFSLADTGINKLLSWSDSYLTKLDSTSRVTNSSLKALNEKTYNLVGKYADVKNSIQSMFNTAKKIPAEMWARIKRVEGSKELFEHKAKLKMSALFDEDNGKIKNIYDRLMQNDGFIELSKGLKVADPTMGFTLADFRRHIMNAYEFGVDLGEGATTRTLRKRSVMSMLEDSNLQEKMGFPKADADFFTNFISENNPELIERFKNLSANPEGLLFELKGTLDNGVEVYKFRDEVYTELIKFKDNLSQEGNQIYKTVNMIDEKLAGELLDIGDEIHALQQLQAQGVTRVLRDGVQESGEMVNWKNEYMELMSQTSEIDDAIEAIHRNQSMSPALREKVISKHMTKRQTLEEAIEAVVKKQTDFVSNSGNYIDVQAALDKANFRREEIRGLYGEVPVFKKDIEKSWLNAEFDTARFYSQKEVDVFNRLIESPEFIEAITEVHLTMDYFVDLLREVNEVNFKFDNGYLSHRMTNERLMDNLEKRIMGGYGKAGGDLKGNARTHAKRAWDASVQEANQLSKLNLEYTARNITDPKLKKTLLDSASIKLFEDDIHSSMADFITKTPKTVEQARILNVVTMDSLTNPEHKLMLRPTEVIDNKVPQGYVSVAEKDLKDKLKNMKSYMVGNNDPQAEQVYNAMIENLEGFLDKKDKGIFYMDANVYSMIGILNNPKVKTNALLDFIDAANTVFKTNKVATPGFHVRNMLGNYSQIYLTGVPLGQFSGYMRGGRRDIKVAEDLMSKMAKLGAEAMTGDELATIARYDEFIKTGFSNMGNALHDVDPAYWGGAKARKIPVYGNLIDWNLRMNGEQDKIFRYSLWQYAKDNPEHYISKGFNTAEEFVRFTLFDYTDLTKFEKDVMRRVIPFYTFTRKNLAFQMKNFAMNPEKYNRLQKTLKGTWRTFVGEDSADWDTYKVENFWIPLPINKDGKYITIKASLPLGDVGEFIENPLRRIVASMAPAVRAPFELATNTQIFSGMPIQEFKGQRGFQIPEISRGAEYALNQLGLDVPVRQVADIARSTGALARQETGAGDFLLDAIGSSIMSRGDVNKTRTRSAYDKLDNLENLMRYYKQEGVDILTIAEIQNKEKVNYYKSIISRVRALRGQ